MRTDRLLLRAAKTKARYNNALKGVPFNTSDALRHLALVFGPSVQRLPPSLRVELLYPHLQQFPHRANLFSNLSRQGSLLLTILMNDHLGTRNVVLPSKIVARFCEQRDVTKELGSQEHAVAFVYHCVGAMNLFAGLELCKDMVRDHILTGSVGLSALYLDALSNNEL